MRRLLALGLVLLLLAGCAGGAKPQSATTSAAPESAVAVGRTVDDQLLPLAGVDVGVPALKVAARTGPDGAFRLEGLPAGVHEVVASKVGHTTARERVTLEAGAVLEGVELRLPAIAPPKVPYNVPFVGKGFIACAVKAGALTLTNVQTCESHPNHNPFFDFEVTRSAGLVAVVLELAWTPSAPGTAEALREELLKNPNCFNGGCAPEVRYGIQSGTSPIRWTLGNATQPFQDSLELEGPTRLTVFSHVSRDLEPLVVVAVQQEVQFYVTAFYNSEPTEGYTLVPG